MAAKTRAVVFANGEYSAAQAQYVKATDADFIVCVDGGVRHCLAQELNPNLLVGDLDSLDKASAATVEQLGTERIQFPEEKDASDLELALHSLESHSFNEVVVLGASGGRSDHHLFNWQLFASHVWPFQLRIVDDTIDALVIDPARPIDLSVTQGQVFSVATVAGDARGVTVTGVRYPLDKATLKPGSTIGLSNWVNEQRLHVSVEHGILLVMFVHKER